MIRRAIKRAATILAVAVAVHSPSVAGQQAYSFYVLNQRSVALTAQYWNPILTHVSRTSGVPLELKLTKTAQEGNAIAERGGYDFQYTNHFFTPERDRLGYKVIARYARRESFAYRALWTSEIYQDLCIMAYSKVPADKVAAVRAALINMAKDPAGREVLEAGAELLRSTGELGFVAAEDRDYDNYRKFYRTTQVK